MIGRCLSILFNFSHIDPNFLCVVEQFRPILVEVIQRRLMSVDVVNVGRRLSVDVGQCRSMSVDVGRCRSILVIVGQCSVLAVDFGQFGLILVNFYSCWSILVQNLVYFVDISVL